MVHFLNEKVKCHAEISTCCVSENVSNRTSCESLRLREDFPRNLDVLIWPEENNLAGFVCYET